MFHGWNITLIGILWDPLSLKQHKKAVFSQNCRRYQQHQCLPSNQVFVMVICWVIRQGIISLSLLRSGGRVGGDVWVAFVRNSSNNININRIFHETVKFYNSNFGAFCGSEISWHDYETIFFCFCICHLLHILMGTSTYKFKWFCKY